MQNKLYVLHTLAGGLTEIRTVVLHDYGIYSRPEVTELSGNEILGINECTCYKTVEHFGGKLYTTVYMSPHLLQLTGDYRDLIPIYTIVNTRDKDNYMLVYEGHKNLVWPNYILNGYQTTLLKNILETVGYRRLQGYFNMCEIDATKMHCGVSVVTKNSFDLLSIVEECGREDMRHLPDLSFLVMISSGVEPCIPFKGANVTAILKRANYVATTIDQRSVMGYVDYPYMCVNPHLCTSYNPISIERSKYINQLVVACALANAVEFSVSFVNQKGTVNFISTAMDTTYDLRVPTDNKYVASLNIDWGKLLLLGSKSIDPTSNRFYDFTLCKTADERILLTFRHPTLGRIEAISIDLPLTMLYSGLTMVFPLSYRQPETDLGMAINMYDPRFLEFIQDNHYVDKVKATLVQTI